MIRYRLVFDSCVNRMCVNVACSTWHVAQFHWMNRVEWTTQEIERTFEVYSTKHQESDVKIACTDLWILSRRREKVQLNGRRRRGEWLHCRDRVRENESTNEKAFCKRNRLPTIKSIAKEYFAKFQFYFGNIFQQNAHCQSIKQQLDFSLIKK